MRVRMEVIQTSFNGFKQRWIAEDERQPREPIESFRDRVYMAAFECAIADGWTPPKWWQFWRRDDTRMLG